MAFFIARVELYGATVEVYEKLNSALQAVGFNRTITGADGKKFALPTGTYSGNLDASSGQANEIIKGIAAQLHPKMWVLVAETTGWNGYLAQV